MGSLLILVGICFSATAFAQSTPPKVVNKPLVQVKPKEPMGAANSLERSRAQSYGLVTAQGQSFGPRFSFRFDFDDDCPSRCEVGYVSTSGFHSGVAASRFGPSFFKPN